MQKRYLFTLTIVVGLILPAVFPYGNKIKFGHLSIDNGLSQSVINCIFQDNRGFKWFGTQDGLYKFDGYVFKAYKSIPFDSASLTDNWIQAIAEDGDGTLWIGTYSGGLFEFDRDSETFKNFSHNSKIPNSLINNRIWSILIAKNGLIWIGTSGGLEMFDKTANVFSHYVNNPDSSNGLSNNAVNAVCEDDNGCLWLGTWGGGLDKFDEKKKTFSHFIFGKKGSAEYSDNFIKTVAEDGNYLWLGTKRTLLKFNKTNGKVDRYFIDKENISYPDENSILSLLLDSQKKLWIGTHDNGLYLLDTKTGNISNFKYDRRNPYTISDNWISSLYRDSQGIYWFGTGKGVDKMLPYSLDFDNIEGTSSTPDSFGSTEINSIFEDHEGLVWIGTWNAGLYKYDPVTKKSECYKHSVSDPGSLINDIVWGVFEDSDNILWVGTYAGLTILDRKTGKFKRPPFSYSELHNQNISEIYEDSKHFMWIGTWGGGLYRYDKTKNTLNAYLSDPEDPSSLSDNLITCIYEDRDENLWIGTNAGGLNKFDYKNRKFERFEYNAKNPSTLSNNNISSVFQDSNGMLWVGTWGGGLNALNMKTKVFEHYTESDGLSNNIILGIIEDSYKNLWLSTNRGLSRFDLNTHLFINYDAKDGLGNDQFSQGCVKLKNGSMLFGGLNGISVVYPDNIGVDAYRPAVAITSFRIFNKEKKTGREISGVKNIVLNYLEHDFSIEFSGLDYSRPDKIKYAYRLEGYDENWIYIGNNRYAYYTNMEPGEYIFKVKAANRDNFWSAEPTTLKITIIPPFWKTWPFFLLIAFLASALVYIIYKFRVEQLLKVERMRTSIATDLHDDIGASLTRISLFSDAALRSLHKFSFRGKNENGPLGSVESLLTEIGDNSRRLIGSMSDIVWTVNPQNDSFENITIRMMDYTSKLFEVNEIDYRITVDPGLSSLSLPMDFRRNLFLIYKESISNIVKHAEATQVEINVLKENGSLVLVIEDNGKGFAGNGGGMGNGLKNIQRRTSAFGGNFQVSSRSGNGTLLKAVMKLP